MNNDIQDFFLCDNCANKNFAIVHNFSLRFHSVNFADRLIYDRLVDEVYQCTKCHKIFSKQEMEEGLRLKRKHREC